MKADKLMVAENSVIRNMPKLLYRRTEVKAIYQHSYERPREKTVITEYIIYGAHSIYATQH